MASRRSKRAARWRRSWRVIAVSEQAAIRADTNALNACSSCPRLSRASTSYLFCSCKQGRGWPGQARPWRGERVTPHEIWSDASTAQDDLGDHAIDRLQHARDEPSGGQRRERQGEIDVISPHELARRRSKR